MLLTGVCFADLGQIDTQAYGAHTLRWDSAQYRLQESDRAHGLNSQSTHEKELGVILCPCAWSWTSQERLLDGEVLCPSVCNLDLRSVKCDGAPLCHPCAEDPKKGCGDSEEVSTATQTLMSVFGMR